MKKLGGEAVLGTSKVPRIPVVARALGVVGEVMLTLGVLSGLFLGWHVVLNDLIQAGTQTEAAREVAQEWTQPAPPEQSEEVAPLASPTDLEPPIIDAPAEGDVFALLYVPRFGENYVRTIAEGVDLATVLNSPTLGIGRYPQSDELGEIGNFAVAGHRTTFGATFANIGELRVGDRLYVEVPSGWYSYQFRNLEYVWPTEVEVLNSFPKMTEEAPGTRVITLTSCHPRFSEAERIIAYGIYEGWYPREGGPPSEISHLMDGAT
jgi:sortase A